jgi:hypothetical protein
MFQDTDETNSASQFESLLDQILREDPIDSDRRKFLRDQEILRENNELSFDFTFKSIVERCMHGGDRYNESAEIIFKYLLSKPHTRHNQRLMMSVIPDVLNKPTKMKHYYQFFNTYYKSDNRPDQERLQLKSFMPEETCLPLSSVQPLTIQKIKFDNKNYYLNIDELCSDAIWDSDQG